MVRRCIGVAVHSSAASSQAFRLSEDGIQGVAGEALLNPAPGTCAVVDILASSTAKSPSARLATGRAPVRGPSRASLGGQIRSSFGRGKRKGTNDAQRTGEGGCARGPGGGHLPGRCADCRAWRRRPPPPRDALAIGLLWGSRVPAFSGGTYDRARTRSLGREGIP